MKRKETQASVVITFHTTAEAMAVEQLCGTNNIPGKLISAPREFSADCGIAWCGPKDSSEALKELITAASIDYDGFHFIDR